MTPFRLVHVVSTAGHVDHGKSTLIERLTGIDPDRLAEEKARGLTIDLGFAWMQLPSGREIGIVDVPGHERFVHNMLAGVGSIDTTIFVVAANEGWRRQSEEHLSILEMLGAKGGVVALTKIDTVDHGRAAAVREQIAGRLEGTALAKAEIVGVSAVTGEGIDALAASIDRALDRAGGARDRDRPRVFVDRCFTIHGVGTVITGTLTGGKLRVDDHVLVLPAGHRARIRGIQTHRRVITEAEPVSRVALNLAGLERTEIGRGDAVVLPGQWQASSEVDVVLRTVRSLDHEIVSRGSFKVHLGSAEIDARLHIYGTNALRPGDESYARLVLIHPVIAEPLDRFVLRDVGRRETVGGGLILDPHPPTSRGAARDARHEQLRTRARAAPDRFPTLVVAERGFVARADLEWLSGSGAGAEGTRSLRTLEVAESIFEDFAGRIEQTLESFHARQPLVRGMSREEVREQAGIRNVRLFTELVDALSERIAAEGPLLRLTTHRVVLTLEQEGARDVLLNQLSEAAFRPPSLEALHDAHGVPLVRALIEAGTLVKIADDLVFTAAQLDQAKAIIADATGREGPLTAARIKELLDTTRKYAIPLLEYLDRTGFTRRRGDVRELV